MKFIKIVDDNTGDVFYANPVNIAYLKATPPHKKGKFLYKVILRNGNWKIIVDEAQFIRIKNELYGE